VIFADWNAVVEQVRWKNWVVLDKAGLLSVAVGDVTVELTCRDVGGRRRLIVASLIGELARIAPQTVIALNAEVWIGSFVGLRDKLALRTMLSFGRFDADDLEEAITEVARAAQLARAQLRQPAPRADWAERFAD